jgi:hypothetical protein
MVKAWALTIKRGWQQQPEQDAITQNTATAAAAAADAESIRRNDALQLLASLTASLHHFVLPAVITLCDAAGDIISGSSSGSSRGSSSGSSSSGSSSSSSQEAASIRLLLVLVARSLVVLHDAVTAAAVAAGVTLGELFAEASAATYGSSSSSIGSGRTTRPSWVNYMYKITAIGLNLKFALALQVAATRQQPAAAAAAAGGQRPSSVWPHLLQLHAVPELVSAAEAVGQRFAAYISSAELWQGIESCSSSSSSGGATNTLHVAEEGKAEQQQQQQQHEGMGAQFTFFLLAYCRAAALVTAAALGAYQPQHGGSSSSSGSGSADSGPATEGGPAQQQQQQQQWQECLNHFMGFCKVAAAPIATKMVPQGSTSSSSGSRAEANSGHVAEEGPTEQKGEHLPDLVAVVDDFMSFCRLVAAAVPLSEVCNNPSCECLGGLTEAAAAVKACGKCGTRYCSHECQQAHWGQHKKACRRLRLLAGNASSHAGCVNRRRRII